MSNGMEEPDVTPLINVNLVILVMVLAIASHAAKLLPLKLEGGSKIRYIKKEETVPLVISREGFKMGGELLDKDGLSRRLEEMRGGDVLLVEVEGGDYSNMVEAIDCIMGRKDIKVSFGNMLGRGINVSKKK